MEYPASQSNLVGTNCRAEHSIHSLTDIVNGNRARDASSCNELKAVNQIANSSAVDLLRAAGQLARGGSHSKCGTRVIAEEYNARSRQAV